MDGETRPPEAEEKVRILPGAPPSASTNIPRPALSGQGMFSCVRVRPAISDGERWFTSNTRPSSSTESGSRVPPAPAAGATHPSCQGNVSPLSARTKLQAPDSGPACATYRHCRFVTGPRRQHDHSSTVVGDDASAAPIQRFRWRKRCRGRVRAGVAKTPAAIRDALHPAQRSRFEAEYRAGFSPAP